MGCTRNALAKQRHSSATQLESDPATVGCSRENLTGFRRMLVCFEKDVEQHNERDRSMSKSWTIFSIICAVTFLFCVLFVSEVVMIMAKPKLGPAVLPVQSLKVMIGTEDQKQLVTQFKKFSDANGFTMYVSQVTPDPRNIVIELRRDDVVINAANPFSPSKFSIDFYKNFYKTDAVSPPSNVVDALVKSLETFVPEIQNDPSR
jgi:hypothetical protein